MQNHEWMKKMRIVAIGFGCLLALSLPAAAVDVENIRTWPAPDHTRVVLDTDSSVEYALFVLRNPDRVVVDLRGARFTNRIPRANPNDHILAGIRAGRRGSNDLRIVFDLKQPGKPNSFLLEPNQKYGHRLVIDVYTKDTGATEAQPARQRSRRPDPTKLRDVIIAVDPGHGGEDPGALTASGLHEKNVVLAIARALAHQINRTRGMKAVLIRDGDYYVGLRRRMKLARDYDADLLVSIHADSFRDSRVSGSSVYILSHRGASSEAARWLAEQENSSDLVGGISLDDKDGQLASVLLDLSQTATLTASSEIGTRVLKSLGGIAKQHKRRVERANFVVLRSPDIPSILIETGFLTNASDVKRLSNPKHQKTIATTIFNGIHDYFEHTPPPGTMLATQRHTIAYGETLSDIAVKYRIPIDRLRVVNQINGDTIRAGEVLRIPRLSGG